LTLIIRHYHG